MAEQERVAIAFVAILIVIAVVGFAWFITKPAPQPRPVVVRQPINFTDTGKAVGKRVGRFGIGFVKGLFTSGDDK